MKKNTHGPSNDFLTYVLKHYFHSAIFDFSRSSWKTISTAPQTTLRKVTRPSRQVNSFVVHATLVRKQKWKLFQFDSLISFEGSKKRFLVLLNICVFEILLSARKEKLCLTKGKPKTFLRTKSFFKCFGFFYCKCLFHVCSDKINGNTVFSETTVFVSFLQDT